ncbi:MULTISPECIES: hypothetical protein [Rhizobium]|uniref:hypothetical protein n=1 Tax=Rhizobium TaxID=379 RepID=UPI0013D4E467|nr:MULTISPECIES: hypothetical protein [Rhizobium]
MHADGDMSLQRIDRGRVIVIVRRLCHRAVEEKAISTPWPTTPLPFAVCSITIRAISRADIRAIYAAAF